MALIFTTVIDSGNGAWVPATLGAHWNAHLHTYAYVQNPASRSRNQNDATMPIA